MIGKGQIYNNQRFNFLFCFYYFFIIETEMREFEKARDFMTFSSPSLSPGVEGVKDSINIEKFDTFPSY